MIWPVVIALAAAVLGGIIMVVNFLAVRSAFNRAKAKALSVKPPSLAPKFVKGPLCVRCGSDNLEAANFCARCGFMLKPHCHVIVWMADQRHMLQARSAFDGCKEGGIGRT